MKAHIKAMTTWSVHEIAPHQHTGVMSCHRLNRQESWGELAEPGTCLTDGFEKARLEVCVRTRYSLTRWNELVLF